MHLKPVGKVNHCATLPIRGGSLAWLMIEVQNDLASIRPYNLLPGPFSSMTLARINKQLAVLLQDAVAEWEREELAEKLAALSPELRRQALKHLPVIWPVSYALYYAFVDQLARAATCLHPSQISPWVNATLDCYEADGLRAAQLYLEEVEANFLCQIRGEVGVRLAQVEHRLLPYARGILGRELRVAAAETASFDTDTLALAPEINLFPNQAQNFLLYKFTTTFLLALDRLGSFRAQEVDGEGHPQPLARFIGGFADPRFATDLFYVAEAIRILARFQHDFPGLMGDFAEICPALIEQTPASRQGHDQTAFVATLRRWLLHHFAGPLAMAGAPLPQELQERLVAHGSGLTDARATLALTRVLYRYGETLPGPYLAGADLPFMGELKIAEAVTAMDHRREEREEKLVKALNRMMNDQAKPQGDEEGDGGEERSGQGRQPLSEDEGSMLLGQAGRQLDAAELEKQLAQGVLRIGGMEFELTEELQALLREMAQEEGLLPAQAMVSALGRSGGGLGQEVSGLDDDDGARAAPGPLTYDEWDFRRAGFRKQWCQVQVKEISPVAGTFVATTLDKYRGLLLSLRRQFEMMSVQETFVRRQRDGDEIDLDAVIEALSDARIACSSACSATTARSPPSSCWICPPPPRGG